MKRFGCAVLLMIVLCVLCGCETQPAECDHKYKVTSYDPPTCIATGTEEYTCSKCGDTYSEELAKVSYHTSKTMTTVKEPTLDERGQAEGVCDICGQTFTSSISEIGKASSTPYEIDSSALWKKVKSQGGEVFVGRYLQVKGTVKSVSSYGEMNGYYLQGKTGEGLVCWVYERTQSVKKGDKVTFVGYVAVDNGTTSIELTNCEAIR